MAFDKTGFALGIIALVVSWAIVILAWFEAMACLGFLQSR